MSVKEIIKWILLFCVIIGAVIIYQPDIYRTVLYGQIKNLLMGGLGCLFLISYPFEDFTSSPFLRKVSFGIVIIALEFLLFYLFSLNINSDDLIQLVLILLFILIGMGVGYNRRALVILCTLYSVAALVLAVLSVNTYLGGFDLTVDQHLISGKNQVGAIVAVGGGLAFYFSQHTTGKLKWLYISLAFAIFSVLLVIRCRTALIAYIFFVAVYVLRYWSGKSKAYFFFCLIFISIIFSDIIVDIFNSVIIENKDAEDLNAVSTGRFDRNVLGVEYLLSHFFDGELFEKSNIALIHNYILLRLVRYGIWGITFVYVYFLFVIDIVRCFKKQQSSLELTGAYLLTIPLFCSLLEPSAPFGPGTMQLMPYLLYGIAIKADKQDVENEQLTPL